MDVAEVLELLQGAPTGFRTLRATIRTRTHGDVAAKAWERWREEMEALGTHFHSSADSISFVVSDEAQASDTPEEPTTDEETTRIWVQPPLVREEATWGTSWSLRHPELFRPLAELWRYDLEVGSEALVAGRAGVEVRGVLRGDARPDPLASLTGPPSGRADEIRFVVDRERGFLLRHESSVDGEPFEEIEVVDVDLDVDLNADLFVEPEPEPAPEWRHWSIEEAGSAASFGVYAPSAVWPDASFIVSFSPTVPEHGIFEHVTLTYGERSVGVGQVERQLGLMQRSSPDEPLREPVSEDETENECDDQAVMEGRVTLTLRVDDTEIEVKSRGLDCERLFSILDSLAPVRTAPPGFEP